MAKSRRHSIIERNRFLLRKTWRYFSDLGNPYSDRLNEIRSNVLNNQLNFILSGTLLILLILTITINLASHLVLETGTLRVAIMLAVSVINLVLSYYNYHNLSKYSLIFLTPLVFIFFPILSGYVEEEGYTYNAYVLIAGSVLPQLLLSPEREKFLYWFSMTYYLVLVMIVDLLMIKFQQSDFLIVERIMTFYPFYKVAQLGVFVFVGLAIYHLKKVTLRFEDRLSEKNMLLDQRNRKLKMQSDEITRQKDMIEESSRSIIESINYASRIQNAVLKPLNFIDKWGIENFIMYKPVAVVSGDFYWGREIDDKIIITTVDCTGHGVPGAFMSMLGLSLLDDIFDARTYNNPAEVLNILRENMIVRLRQTGERYEPHDGMDLSMCIIDRKNIVIEYANAINAAYLVRNGELIKLEADPMPIGFFLSIPKPFTNRKIEIREGDRLYMFSDGYADQSGGEKKKRFMIRPFLELLVSVHQLPMHQQKMILEDTFEKWRGEHEQIDDVLVLGLKL